MNLHELAGSGLLSTQGECSSARGTDIAASARTSLKERPILFSSPMVRAILEGRKTQTRRVVKDQAALSDLASPHATKISVGEYGICFDWMGGVGSIPLRCPFGVPGYRLWVRETTEAYALPHLLTGEPTNAICGRYTSDKAPVLDPREFDYAWWYSKPVCPAIHMPRWASRLMLRITDVRVEPLQNISHDDCLAEGIECHQTEVNPSGIFRVGNIESTCPIEAYALLWESINGKGSWDANPWVWAVSFKVAA